MEVYLICILCQTVMSNVCVRQSLLNMAGTVISAKYPPRIDPTRTTLAYGNLALPRLVSNYYN